jgi:hypothetical protein
MNDNITVVATTTWTVPLLRSGVNGSPGGEVQKFILGHVRGAALARRASHAIAAPNESISRPEYGSISFIWFRHGDFGESSSSL